jgi:ABC-type transport system involved in multi-copper enzyme maturation permease subunit
VRAVSEPATTGWQRHLRDDLWGAFVVARRELWANLISFRSVVMIILLALIIFLAATGFSSFVATNTGERGEAYLYHVLAADPDGILNDVSVYVYYTDDIAPIMGRNVSLVVESHFDPSLRGVTDARGTVVLKNLTAAFHVLNVSVRAPQDTGFGDARFGGSNALAGQLYIPGIPGPYPSLSVDALEADLDGKARDNDVIVHVVGPSGGPLQGAEVSVSNGMSNVTDANGVARFLNLKKGHYNASATSGGVGGFAQVDVSAQSTARNPFALALEGPDQVLSIVAQIGIGLMGPIYVIALCFDTISREKISGSIDYLLCRPMGRRAVLLGKFAGVLAAMMVPITLVSMAGVAIIAWKSGHSPSAGAIVGFLFYTVLLIGIFALLQMLFSTLSKTTGTAVLSGIGLWLFFFLMFGVIIAVVGQLRGMTTDAYSTFSARADLFNPIGLYGMSMGTAIDHTAPGGLPLWAPGVAMLVTLLIYLVLALEVFQRRATE